MLIIRSRRRRLYFLSDMNAIWLDKPRLFIFLGFVLWIYHLINFNKAVESFFCACLDEEQCEKVTYRYKRNIIFETILFYQTAKASRTERYQERIAITLIFLLGELFISSFKMMMSDNNMAVIAEKTFPFHGNFFSANSNSSNNYYSNSHIASWSSWIKSSIFF